MTTEPTAIYIIGDQFARQARDSGGFPSRLFQGVEKYTQGKPIPVIDLTTKGGLREVTRAASASEILGGSVAVLVVGAVDSRGGGPPLVAFMAHLRRLVAQVKSSGASPILVLAPPCPAEAARIKGFAKGSRRWLRRVAPLTETTCRDLGVPYLRPQIPAHGWADQLALKPSGIEALVEQVLAVVVHEAWRLDEALPN